MVEIIYQMLESALLIILSNINLIFVLLIFSTSYIKTTNDTIDYLDAIVYKLTNIKCKLIFLFLPRDDHQSRIPFYNFVKKILRFPKKLYYIDLNEYISYSSEICRDSVHTTDIGSEKYADLIYSQFIKIKVRLFCLWV